MLKALDSYHLFIKGIKVVPEVPSSETNAFGEKSIFGALYYQSFIVTDTQHSDTSRFILG